MGTELIAVLDVDTREEALRTVEACGACRWFKIGSQLFTHCGPGIVGAVQERGKDVFLDLKYHDIPNTVGAAVRAAAALGVRLLTVHACGGSKMIGAARQAVEGTDTRILAVTVLTSLDEEALRAEVGLPESPQEAVRRYARLAVGAGAHGVVASPHEIGLIREEVGGEPLIVTPGVRPAWASADDQARVLTPREAAQRGANFVVVGRPILRHANPAEAVRRIQEELTV